jgi:hypothetical protein
MGRFGTEGWFGGKLLERWGEKKYGTFVDGAKLRDSQPVSASTGCLFARTVVVLKREGSPGFALWNEYFTKRTWVVGSFLQKD